MSEKATPEELRARAINGVESYKAGYRHGLAESEHEVGLLRLTIEQLRTRIANADEHIRLLEATVRRVDKVVLDPDATVVYSHSMDPSGIQYRQYAKDPLPAWAVNVRAEVVRAEAIAKAAAEITSPGAKGYRPPCCDRTGGNGSKCCRLPCAADRELREMGLL